VKPDLDTLAGNKITLEGTTVPSHISADFEQCLNIFRSLHGAPCTIYKKSSKIFKFCFGLKVLMSISSFDAKKRFLKFKKIANKHFSFLLLGKSEKQ
jgi:hypothetical protein